MVAEEAAEKTLGGALGISRLGSWKRTSRERCCGLGLLPGGGGRGGFFNDPCLFRADPAAETCQIWERNVQVQGPQHFKVDDSCQTWSEHCLK